MKKILSLTFLLAAFNFSFLNAQINFYGFTSIGGNGPGQKGTIFQYTLGTGAYIDKFHLNGTTEGSTPKGSFISVGDSLYALTSAGGGSGNGVIIKYNPFDNSLVRKFTFIGTSFGAKPEGSFVNFKNKLVGMTSLGGYSNNGVIVTMNKPFNTLNQTFILAQPGFSDYSGSSPFGSFIIFGNKLFGMTYAGGIGNPFGTIISFDPDATLNKLTIWHDFEGGTTDGSLPMGDLTVFNGKLYGMTSTGGINNKGTLFVFDTAAATNKMTILKSFGGSDGENPFGSLTIYNGKLYGMTYAGGANTTGVIFEYDLATGFTKKVDFGIGSVPINPEGSLIVHGDKLYGMTPTGGANNVGTIFEYNPQSATITSLYSFTAASNGGHSPKGDLFVVTPPVSQQINNWENITLTYGDVLPITAVASSGLPLSFTVNDNITSITGNNINALAVGTSTITAYQEGNINNEPVTSTITITVLKKELIVSTTDNSREPCDPNPSFPVNINGFVNLDDASDLFQQPSFSTSAGSYSGTYPIIGSNGNDELYSFTYVNGTMTVLGNDILPAILGKNTISVTNEASFFISPLSPNASLKWTYTGENIFMIGDSISPKFTVYAKSNAKSGEIICIVENCSFIDTLRHNLNVNPFPTLEHFLTRLTCEPVQSNCDSSYIISFNIDKIFETPVTDCSPSGYSDYTDSDVMASLFIGEAYTINLVAGGFPSYFGLWIDYNNNGDFGDAQEMVSANFDPGFQYIVPNILVPNLASIEGPKRMRIRTRLTRPFTAEESCPDGTEAGETEDYLLNFEIRPALNAPNFLSPNNDGENDFFVIRGVDFTEENNLLIIDNMGKVILEESDYKNNWPSQDNLASLKDGVYYYIFRNGHSEIRSYLELSR